MDNQKIRDDLKYDLENCHTIKIDILPAWRYYLPIVLTVVGSFIFFIGFPFKAHQLYTWLYPLEPRGDFFGWDFCVAVSCIQSLLFLFMFSSAINFMMLDKSSLRSADFLRTKILQALAFYLCLYMGLFVSLLFYLSWIDIGVIAFATIWLSNAIAIISIGLEIERLSMGVVFEVMSNFMMSALGKNPPEPRR